MTKTTTTNGVSLSAIRNGTSAQIQQIQGGHHFLSRLAALGFTPGARIKVIQNFGRGPIIVCLRDTRVALGRGEAVKIVVRQVEDGNNDGR
ncbi:MAG: ferrous iron transport protein A [Chloroflexi bacterium]|jgi:ferrous iron transport protein A|nr:ferrous iron transport protein A [Chloroflexota bacterium]